MVTCTSLMALMDDLGELLPHLPALRPPRLLDLATGILVLADERLFARMLPKGKLPERYIFQ